MAIVFPPSPTVGDRFTPTGQEVTYECIATNPNQWQVLVAGIVSGQQAGTILWHGSRVVPTGYLECNGAAVSRTTYSRLFAVIGTTFGAGNGSTTFNVPDLRGQFVRGQNNTASGTDPNRNLGSIQDHAMQDHRHLNAGYTGGTGGWNPLYILDTTSRTGIGAYGSLLTSTGGVYTFKASVQSPGIPESWNTASETRPTNMALVPIIKAFDAIDDPAVLQAQAVINESNAQAARITDLEKQLQATNQKVAALDTEGQKQVNRIDVIEQSLIIAVPYPFPWKRGTEDDDAE